MNKQQSQHAGHQDLERNTPHLGSPLGSTRPAGIHLDDNEFAELMMGGAASAATESHLESCAACREELGRFQDSVSDFGLASLAWSEARSAALPALPRVTSKPAPPRLFPVVSWGLAALLLAGLAVPVKTYLDARHELHAGNAGASGGGLEDEASGLNSPEQIAKDNQLMAHVSFELSRSQASLLAAYAQQHDGASAGRHRTASAKRTP